MSKSKPFLLKNVLICTVGTSLIGYWKKEYGNDSRKVLRELLSLPPLDIKCGAEITSNHLIIEKHMDECKAIHLLVSDTADGKFVGEVLKKYYEQTFERREVWTIADLNDKDYSSFKHAGLKNLVNKMSDIIDTETQKGFRPVINATGGYKAQISFAGIIGQLFKVPVFYKHERFDNVIEMPPLPVHFDYKLWLKYFDLFFDLEQNNVIKETDVHIFANDFEHLKTLIESDDKGDCTFSAFGLLFHKAFSSRFNEDKRDLLPSAYDGEVKIIGEDKNLGKHTGLKDFLEKVKASASYIVLINTTRNAPPVPRNFFKSGKKIDEIEGTYSTDEMSTKFIIKTTAKNEQERRAVVVDLNQRHSQ